MLRRYHTILVLAALIACVLAELPPIIVTCQSKVLISEDDPFYEESSYEDLETVVFSYKSPTDVEIPYIYALFTNATFIVENQGDTDLSFIFSATSINVTEDSDVDPTFSFFAKGGAETIAAGQSLEFTFEYDAEGYTGTEPYYGMFTALMVFNNSQSVFDPISFRAKTEVFVQGCDSECSTEGPGKGTCIKKVGYCKCEEPWTGKTCQSSFKMLNENREVCPGDPLYISYQLVSASCRGYWSIYPKGEVDPTYETGNLYSDNCVVSTAVPETNVTLRKYFEPGEYRFAYFLTFGANEDGEVVFRVKEWEECGSKYDCSTDPGNPCSGNGDCEDGVCVCKDSYFWQDCSRGCGLTARFTNRSGVIDSDSGTGSENKNPLYMQQTNCTWYIIPEGKGVDLISINFTRFHFWSSGDILYVRSLNKNGEIDKSSSILGRYTGTSLPQYTEFKADKIALVFVTSYQGSSLGFRLEYDVITEPLSPGWIAFIVIAVILVVVVIVTDLVLFSVHRKKLRDEALKLAKAARSEPWVLGIGEDELVQNDRAIGKDGVVPELSELEKILGWMDMKSINFECSDYDLRFGLEERVPCPVMTELHQVITITNSSNVPLAFCFFHPVENYTLQCSLVPGKGTLAPGTGIRVQVNLKLMYTTRLDASIKCAVWRGARGPGDFYAFATADGITAETVPEKPKKKNPLDDEEEETVDPSVQFQERISKSKPLKVARLTIHLEGAVSERIDPTEVVLNPDPLGEGAYGVVYSGRYRGRFVAVKVMSRQHDLLEQITKDFEKEIDLYRRLHNPLIVEFVGASLIPGKLCMCTELIQRGSLEQLINETEIPLALQLRFAMNIAEAVAFLHSNNVLYRDLKPSNIMIVSTSLNSKVNCKIGDFGTARNVKDVTESFFYTQGQGTPIYMAPEVLAVKPYNSKADVYSFAITLWQMTSREKPWLNVPVWDIPTRVIHGKRPQMVSGLRKDYSDVIRKCWAGKPEDRPSFPEVLDLLAPIAKRVKKDSKKEGKGKRGLYVAATNSGSTVDFTMTLDESLRTRESTAISNTTTTATGGTGSAKR